MTELLNQYIESANQNFELFEMKVDAVMESTFRQLDINYGEAELKVMRESGTSDDLTFLYEEARNDALEKIKKTIQGIKDAIMKYFSDMKDRCMALLTSQKVKDTLDKIKKKINIIPLLKQKKIMIVNYVKQEKCAAEAMGKLTMIKAKLKSGQEIATDNIEEVVGKYDVEHSKLLGVSNAVGTTLGEAMTMVHNMSSKASSIIKGSQDEVNKHLDDCKEIANKAISAANAAAVTALAKAFGHVAKQKTEDFFRWCSDSISSIKNAISSFRNKNSDSDDLTEESTDMDMDKLADAATSSENNTTEEYGECDEQDPWDSVMTDLSNIGVGSDTVPNDLENGGFDSVFDNIFGDTPYPTDETGCCKESSDDEINDLFNSIFNEATGNVDESSDSVYADLLSQMDNLF